MYTVSNRDQMTTTPNNPTRQMLEELSRYVIAEPYPLVLDLKKCHGSWLATIDGREIFDWAGYFGSKLIAHNHPGLSEPEYLRNSSLAANNKTANPDFLTPQCLDYYRLVHGLAPYQCGIRGWRFTRSIPARSGREHDEVFINLHHQKLKKAGKQPGPGRFVYFDQAFHRPDDFCAQHHAAFQRSGHHPGFSWVYYRQYQGALSFHRQHPARSGQRGIHR